MAKSLSAPLVIKSTAALIQDKISEPDNFRTMSDNSRKAKITEEHKAEAALLRDLWEKRKTMSQADFAVTYGIGSQSAVGNFLTARSPLSLKAAKGFARGLRVEVAQFSTRLAKEMQAAPQAMNHLTAFRALAELIPSALSNTKKEALNLLFSNLVQSPEQVDEIAEAFADLLKIVDRPTDTSQHLFGSDFEGEQENKGLGSTHGRSFRVPKKGTKD